VEHGLTDPSLTDAPGIAVIGMAGRFPGAADLGELWDNLARGVESIARFSAAELRAAGVAPALLADPRHVAAAGVLDGADLFDAPLFQTTPREAELLDPQQRVFLECAWAALEDAGYDPARYGQGTGIFAGASLSSYLLANLLPAGEAEAAGAAAMLGNDKDFLTTRVSYKLGLTGPSLDVQSACSTSLVAVVLACQSLLNYQCDLALAGGVAVREPQRAGYLYQEGGILSPDGRCRPFDAAARGTVPGNGVGIAVLKRLEDALADGDAIRAVVRGAALNNDGAAKAGFTAPSVAGQAEVVAMALAIAGVAPEEVSFVEAHGTATPLGDPIELRALARAFRGAPRQACALGSIKGNLGHLDAAAGVAGFLKAVLALEHRAIPPTLHFERPNPELDLDASPFYVNAELVPWESRDGRPRRAGVSSFGIGGTNAHVVLEEAPPRQAAPALPGDGRAELVVLSARTSAALAAASARLAAHLAARPEIPLADVALTLRLGRKQLGFRRAIVARDTAAAVVALGGAGEGVEAPVDPPGVAFLLPGQGARIAAVAAELYGAEEVFRDEIDACCRALAPELGFDLRRVLVPTAGGEGEARERLADTAIAQPALVAVELALARVWESWGIRPATLLGHSLGELAAACLAGVLPRDEALALVAERGRLMAAMPEGTMLAVPLAEAELLPLLEEGGLALAAVNGADRTVASGPPAAIARLAERLAARGVRARGLDVCRAFHSRDVEPVREPWMAAVARARLAPPGIPFLSSLTGTWATAEQATDPAYWGEQMRLPVRFAAGLAELAAEPRVLLEVGPAGGLTFLARRAGAGRTVVGSLPEGKEGGEAGSAHAHLLGALGRLWLAGVEVDWAAVAPGRGRRVPLPTYPFERRRYWISAPGQEKEKKKEKAPGEEKTEAGDGSGVWVPLWRQALAPASALRGRGHDGEAWLVLADGSELGAQLLARLAGDRRAPIVPTAALAGSTFSRVSERAFLVNPSSAADYDELLAVAAEPEQTLRVVHLWSLVDGDAGLASLGHLAGALGRRGGLAAVDLVTAGAVEPVGPPPVPERAALASFCRALAAVRPCRLIDLPPASGSRSSGETRRLAERLAAELTAGGKERTVALRGPQRWVEAWEQAALGAEATLRPGRGYLVAGDLVGATAAELLGALPAPVARIGAVDGWRRAPDFELDPRRLASRSAELAAALAPPPGTAGAEILDPLCGQYALAALASAGAVAGEEIAEAELRRRIALAPGRERLFSRLLAILEEDGTIARRDGVVRFQSGVAGSDPDVSRREIESRSPELAGLCRLLDRAAGALPQVLAGELEGLAVLYPEGWPEGSASLFSKVPADFPPPEFPPPPEAPPPGVPADSAGGTEGGASRFSAPPAAAGDLPTELLAEALATAAGAAGRAGRPFRVLEVGAGQGLLTRNLFSALAGLPGVELKYVFTDVGRSFVLAAERAAADGRRAMRFGMLDASRDPAAQGYVPGTFDAVVAANVVHATPRVVETLGHLRTLLAPGGLLALVETVRRTRWNDLVWGLTDGWWSFADPELRTDSPLLASEAWRRALADAGFEKAATYPEGNATAAGNALVLARRPASDGELFFPADPADPATLAQAVAAARRRLGGLDGAFYVAPGTASAAVPGSAALAGAQAFLAVFEDSPPRFLALCSDAALAPAHAAMAALAAGDGARERAVAVGWPTGRATADPRRLAAVLAAALSCGTPEVALGPPAALSVAASTAAATADEPAALEPATAPDDPAAPGIHDRPRLVNPYVAPRDEVELAVAAIWRRALGIEQIGVDDNFLELGGDSLTGLQVAHALQERWSLGGRAFSLYETPTVAAIARFIGVAQGEAGTDAALPDQGAQGASRGERRRARRASARRIEA